MKIFNLVSAGSNHGNKCVNIAFTELVNDGQNIYPLDEYFEYIPYFIEDLIERIQYNLYTSYDNAKAYLSETGLYKGDVKETAEKIKSAIASMPKKVRNIFASVDDLKTQSKDKTQRMLNMCQENGCIPVEIDPCLDLNSYADETKYKVYAVRTKYGTQEVKFYAVANPSNSELNARAAKAKYALDVDENYFQTRPILYKNWLVLDSYHQMQTA